MVVNRHSMATTTTRRTAVTNSIYDDFNNIDDDDELHERSIGSATTNDDNHHHDSIVMSDRIQRFLQPLLAAQPPPPAIVPSSSSSSEQCDDDDDDYEIRISSTGQVIQKQHSHIFHNPHHLPASSDAVIHINKNILQNETITSFSSITTIVVIIIITTMITILTIGTMIKRKQVLTTKAVETTSSVSSLSCDRSNLNTTTTTTPPTIVNDKDHYKNINDDTVNHLENNKTAECNYSSDNTSVPHLIPDVDEQQNDITTTTMVPTPSIQSGTRIVTIENTTSLIENQQSQNILTLPTTISSSLSGVVSTTVEDTANHIVALVSAFQDQCQLHKVEYDAKIAWQWAMRQQTSDQLIRAQERMDIRQFLFQQTHQTIQHNIQQQHHIETLSVLREDKDWLPKLNAGRDVCYDALLRTIYQCLFGTFILVTVQPMIFMIRLYYTHSNKIMELLLCYNTGTLFDPTIRSTIQQEVSLPSSSYSWFDRYTTMRFLTYMGPYTNTDNTTSRSMVLGDMATCAVYTIGRIMLLFGIVLLMYIASWLLHQLTSGSMRVQQVCKSMFLLWILSIYHWIPKQYLYRMMFCLSILLSILYCAITYQYYTIRHKFLFHSTTVKNKGVRHQPSSTTTALPQISDVNERLSWFDDTMYNIQIIPIIAIGGLLVVVLQQQHATTLIT